MVGKCKPPSSERKARVVSTLARHMAIQRWARGERRRVSVELSDEETMQRREAWINAFQRYGLGRGLSRAEVGRLVDRPGPHWETMAGVLADEHEPAFRKVRDSKLLPLSSEAFLVFDEIDRLLERQRGRKNLARAVSNLLGGEYPEVQAAIRAAYRRSKR